MTAATDSGHVPPVAEQQQQQLDALETRPGSASSSHKSPAAADIEVHDTAIAATATAGDFDQALCLKIDRWLLTPLLLLNFFSLMGRANIGAALIQKLPVDLHLDANAVFLATSIPAVGLMVFEIPSNLLMRWLERVKGLGYVRYLSVMNLGLGVITLGQAFDQSYGALLATRFLIGIFDAGLIPGAVFVCSLYYPFEHLQWRLSMLMVANICSNIVSNILAYGIAQIQNSNGYHGWRWIFIVEGCLTILIALLCTLSPTGRPETARFLTPRERATVAAVQAAQEATNPHKGTAAEWATFLRNPLSYAWASLYVLQCTTMYSVAIFAPSFVQAFNPTFTTPQVQGQVVPIFVVSAAACLLAAFAADRLRHRTGFALFGCALTIVGYSILRLPQIISHAVTMLALYLVAIGVYTSLPMVWNLTLLNLPNPFQRAIGVGFVVGLGNISSFVSAWIFRTSEAPRYLAGMTDGLIMTCVAAGLLVVTYVYIKVRNRALESSRVTGTVTGVEGDVEKTWEWHA